MTHKYFQILKFMTAFLIPALSAASVTKTRFYYLRAPGNLFFASPEQTSCQGYRAFKDFLKTTEIESLSQASSETLFWSAMGEPLDSSNGSCVQAFHPWQPNYQEVIAMKYSAFAYSMDEQSTKILDQYVQRINGTPFFLSQIRYALAEALQCQWEIFSMTDDLFNYEFGGSYFGIYNDMAALHREFQHLEQLFSSLSPQQALQEFMKQKGLDPAAFPQFFAHFAKTGKVNLGCDLSYVGNRKTYLTYKGLDASYDCQGNLCQKIDRR